MARASNGALLVSAGRTAGGYTRPECGLFDSSSFGLPAAAFFLSALWHEADSRRGGGRALLGDRGLAGELGVAVAEVGDPLRDSRPVRPVLHRVVGVPRKHLGAHVGI